MMDVDVAIIGGGPGGATAGTLLAQAGHRVAIFERDPPASAGSCRPRIGESLLPLAQPIFERIGVAATAACLLPKGGAVFHDPGSGLRAAFPFAEGLAGGGTRAWHAARPALDALMLAGAQARGAQLHSGAQVTEVELSHEHATVHTSKGRARARYVIDASGQRAFLARRHRTLEPIRGFGRASVWAHYEGLADAAAQELAATGDIHLVFLPDAWGWLIPLPAGKLSVGIVTRERGVVAEDLQRAFGDFELLQRLTRGASRSDPSVQGNFNFRNTAPFGVRYACVGDAACFLDPIFSTGVSLALVHAAHLCDTLDPALRNGTEAAADLVAATDRHMAHAHGRFAELIRLFYDTPLIHHLVFAEAPPPDVRAGLISMLAGEVWSSGNPFWERLGARAFKARRASEP